MGTEDIIDHHRSMMIYLRKFHHDLTVLPKPGIMVYFRGIIPFYGRTVQVGELLSFTQIWVWINTYKYHF